MLAGGGGHLVTTLRDLGYRVIATDLRDRGCADSTPGVDFLTATPDEPCNILTNPPYKYAKEFIEHGLDILEDGYMLIMFLKLSFLEGKNRKGLYEKNPPKYIYVSSSRIDCAKNGDFTGFKETGNSAVAYAWYVWEKGFTGEPTIRWFN